METDQRTNDNDHDKENLKKSGATSKSSSRIMAYGASYKSL